MSSHAMTAVAPLIAVPESREQETLCLLLRNRGMRVLEVPLVSILDAPDQEPVIKWIDRFIWQPIDLFVILTGEGLRRLLAAAARGGRSEAFIAKLAQVETLVRGPKPEKALMELGLKATHKAGQPTSVGVLAALQDLNPAGKRIFIQLYGTDPNPLLINGILAAGASADVVAPYVYAGREETDRVADFIRRLARGEFRLVAFTSQSQYQRLVDVAKEAQLVAELDQGLRRTDLAAVGPVVRDLLESAGYPVRIMPPKLFFMKPLVAEIVKFLESGV